MEVSPTATVDRNNLTPGDFDRASGFEAVGPINTASNGAYRVQ